MRTFDKVVLLGLPLVVLTAVTVWLIFSKYFYRRLSPNQELQRQRAVSQTKVEVTPAVTPLNAKRLEKSVDSPFMYQSQGVYRVEGEFQGIKGGNLLELAVDNEEKLFFIDGNTKLVCQPTGLLITESGEGNETQANDIFIDDKRQEGIGVPWGIEINREHIVAKVKQKSMTQVFYSSIAGAIPDLPEVVYVWFKSCY